MNRDALQKLVEQARNDPKFLHALVFEPESVLQGLDYLDRGTKASLVSNSPEEAIAALAGTRSIMETPGEYAP